MHVVDVQLQAVAGHAYRVRSTPITAAGAAAAAASRRQQQQQRDWEAAEAAEADGDADASSPAAAAAEVDESLLSQEGEAWVTRISADPQVAAHTPGAAAAAAALAAALEVPAAAAAAAAAAGCCCPQLLPFVIGRGGAKKAEIEQATGASLHIPRAPGPRRDQQQAQQQAPGGSEITIKGPSKEAVASARTRVELLLSSVLGSRMLDWTHFVSLPLSNDGVAAKLEAFKQQVLAQPDAAQLGFHESIFVNPNTLHLTLLMLKLYSDDARGRATRCLEGLRPKVQALLAGQPLRLSLRGLDWMSDDPTDIHVLYLKVVEQGPGQRLAALCSAVVQAFREAGLMLPGQPDAVKLHATIINTRHRRQQPQQQPQQPQAQDGGGGRRPPPRVGFDGTALLARWADLDAGEFELPALHISCRGAFDAATGQYACLASLTLAPDAPA